MVTLTNGDDNYSQDGVGNQIPDTIEALGGDDIILTSTLGGSLVRGADGNDSLYSQGPSGIGNSGDPDTLEGGSGDDTLEFRAAAGYGFGDADNDSLVAVSRTSLYGGAGDDFLRGLLGDNWFSGNEGNDEILIGARDSIYGGKGSDTISLSTNNQLPVDLQLEVLSNIAETSVGTGDRNFISANRDADLVVGWGNRDTIFGGKGDDTLHSLGSQVYVSGDKGDDTIVNFNRTASGLMAIERSTLLGGEGDDLIQGGAIESGNSRSSLDGGAGNDTLQGQGAKDTLSGGEGNDLISISTNSSGLNLLEGDGGNDTLTATSQTDTMFGGQGNDSLYGTFNQGDGGAGNDTIDATRPDLVTPTQITLIGGAGNDSLLGNASSGVFNFFDAGTGNDFIQFGGTNDKLIGDKEGNDTIIAFQTDTSFSFTIEDTLGSNTLSGSLGDDILITGAGDDSIVGGDTNEGGNDSIVAGAGDDIIFGRGGRDTILGGAGNDYIAAGLNGTGDSLIGGEGNDSFVFFTANTSTKLSVIVDFDPNDDRILLSDAGFGLVSSIPGQVLRNADFIALDPGKNYANNANSANPTIIYEIEPLDQNNKRIDSGLLKYDPDGSGGDGSEVITIARLNGNPDINTSDILII